MRWLLFILLALTSCEAVDTCWVRYTNDTAEPGFKRTDTNTGRSTHCTPCSQAKQEDEIWTCAQYAPKSKSRKTEKPEPESSSDKW